MASTGQASRGAPRTVASLRGPIHITRRRAIGILSPLAARAKYGVRMDFRRSAQPFQAIISPFSGSSRRAGMPMILLVSPVLRSGMVE